MLRTIYWFAAFWLYQLFSIFLMVKYKYIVKKGRIEQQSECLSEIAINWGKAMVSWTGSKVEVEGIENIPKEQVLFVSNHQGNFDIPLLIGYVPKLKGFIAKAELKKLPMVNRWMDEIGCVWIERGKPKKSLKAILQGVEQLKQGNTLVLFPEGTRSQGNKMGTFKKGSLKLATKANVPIVPITINGSYKMLEEKNRIQPAKVKIQIHPPIYLEQLTEEEKKNLVDIVYQTIQAPLLD